MRYFVQIMLIIGMINITGRYLYGQSTGMAFPEMKGVTVMGDSVKIPADQRAQFTLIGIAASSKTQEALESWFQPAYDKFIARVGMFDEGYDVSPVFISLFSGANAVLMKSYMKKLLESGNTELYPLVVFYEGSWEDIFSKLQITDKKTPHFFVLQDGKVRYHCSGFYSESKMEAIEELLLD